MSRRNTMQINDMVAAIREEMLTTQESVEDIQAKADAENRELNDAESAEVDSLLAKFEQLQAKAERREKMAAQSETINVSAGRKSMPHITVRSNAADDPKGGFKHFGEFAAAAMVCSRPGAQIDPRLVANAPSTYSTEGVGEDGGFAVPAEFRTNIMQKVNGEDSLLSLTDQQTSASNSVTIPYDETTPWQTSGGVQAYWVNEAAAITQSKLSLKEKQIRLHKVAALVPVTEELMSDAAFLQGYLTQKVGDKLVYKINDSIINGSGAGQPVGILNSACVVSQAKDTAISPVQAADTILYSNIVGMYSRMYAPCRRNGVWLVNQDIEPQLYQMAFDPRAASKVPVYLPPGGASGSPYGTLMGRPIVYTQACQSIGTVGDIIFADLSQYLTITKSGGVKTDVSMHLFFDYDVTAFRMTTRVAGNAWWGSAITPDNSATTLSCFVTLAERA